MRYLYLNPLAEALPFTLPSSRGLTFTLPFTLPFQNALPLSLPFNIGVTFTLPFTRVNTFYPGKR